MNLLLTVFKKYILEQLTPIEKYALNYLELFHTSTDQEKERTSEVRE